ncbi:hypothetical protein HY948_04440 [Candidatus Gottesmanbacteria bacterium]|nr:hypothetical protein [Candidatus Gottesmanbacteria bacterium]
MKQKFLLFFYCLASLSLFLYSYTQVDLNLTLTHINLWQTIQKAFQHVGYFQRPVSTAAYLLILSLFFILYGLSLIWIKRKTINERGFWSIVILVTVLLVFSYPAFSYDMFNYLFTAKTVLIYQKNPYTVLPMQFAGIDSWINFMRWVHLPSAYTPLWIAFTLPAYFFGYQLFLLILWNMKILVAGFYVLSVWCVGAILKKTDTGNALLGMAILALNPLVIMESLVSAHNDIAMMAFSLLSIYWFTQKKLWLSWFFLSTSIALKLMTIFLVPSAIFKWKKEVSLACIVAGLFFVLMRREFLPWYYVWVLPYVALMPGVTVLQIISVGLSFGLLLQYAPYLYLGHWDPPVPMIKLAVVWIATTVSFFSYILFRVVKKSLR